MTAHDGDEASAERSPAERSRGLVNLVLRAIYRTGYPLARLWWWCRRPSAEGVAVVVRAGGNVLVVRQSFRHGLGLVGGGRHPGEEPHMAAVRELCEEVGLDIAPEILQPLGCLQLRYENRDLRAHLFQVELASRPALRPDGAEVVAAEWLMPDQLCGRQDLHPILGCWLKGEVS